MQFITHSALSSDIGLGISFKNQFRSTICIAGTEGGGEGAGEEEGSIGTRPFSREIIKEILRFALSF